MGLDKVKLGTRISVVKSIYPILAGETCDPACTIKIAEGSFDFVSFWGSNGADPKVILISFYFRDERARELCYKQAISAFGSEDAVKQLEDNALEWSNINGCHNGSTRPAPPASPNRARDGGSDGMRQSSRLVAARARRCFARRGCRWHAPSAGERARRSRSGV
jgi:hypothetical protein